MEWLPTLAIIVAGLLTIITICALVMTATCVRMAARLEAVPRNEAGTGGDEHRSGGKVIGRIGPRGRR